MDYTINTKCVQAGYTPGNGEPRQIPIIQSTTYKYDTSEDMGKLFTLKLKDISIQDYRILPTTMLQPRSQLSKAVPLVC